MNRLELPGNGGEAQLRYLDGDYRIVRRGAFVRCAVTGDAIPLDELRYWNVDRQEPYASAAIAAARHQEMLSRR
ncbi:MAG: DUF2093 domain-containing protein [Rhodobiaceae bacterium]|nr:DUF2093 domain-containing protein [Rhodobiaceae bacterium]MCC0054864.1 DUF2093 domain-containing protein [Rhodobiaceae bacterium]